MNKTTLSKLSYKIFSDHDCWKVVEESVENKDIELIPALRTSDNLVSRLNGEVWCLSKATFSNGKVFLASSMCRGDSSLGPTLISVWNGKVEVPLILPPAPPFVLSIDGPDAFCKKFKLKYEAVFPLLFEVVPKFEIMPLERRMAVNP